MSCDLDIMRLKTIDLPIHRDRLEPESLFAIVFGDATKTADRLVMISHAHVEITQHIHRSEIFRVDRDDLTVFLNRRREFS